MTKPVVMVVGANGGTGIEVVRQLLSQDHRVIGTVLNDAEEASLIENVDGLAQIIRLDLADPNAVERRLRDFVSALKAPLAGVIVCAATSNYGPLELMSIDAARRVMDINLFSHLAIYKACLPGLRESKGRLVFMSSFGGRVALPFLGHYVASKFALEGLGDVMRREAAHFGVPVILVQPGGIRTQMALAQLETIDADIAALNDDERHLYGERYAEWKNVAVRTCDACSPPAAIAAVVVEAFKADQPQPRYVAGDDARDLIALSQQASDGELDSFLRNMYSEVGSIAEMGNLAAQRNQ